MAQTVKNLPAMQETQVLSLGREDPLEKKDYSSKPQTQASTASRGQGVSPFPGPWLQSSLVKSESHSVVSDSL